jgi:hypothetical protein
VELSDGIHPRPQEVLTVHANAALTPRARLRLAQLVVEQDWPVARAAERFRLFWPTAKAGPVGIAPGAKRAWSIGSSCPRRSPRATSAPVVRRVVGLRWGQRVGPVGFAALVGLAPSMVYRILVACRINGLSAVDRATGGEVVAAVIGCLALVGHHFHGRDDRI